MSEIRKSFIFYSDWYDAICGLDDNTALEVSKAIMAIALRRKEPILSQTAKAMMMLIRPQIERDIEKWLDIKAKRQEIGRKGGVAKATNYYQLLPIGGKSKQDVASVAVNEDVNVNVESNIALLEEKNDTNVSVKKENKRFIKPTIEEIQAYIFEKGYAFDAEAFYAYYESNGWRVGRNPMKNWKMACTTWAKNRNNNNNNYGRETITDKIRRTVEEANAFSQQLTDRIGNQADVCDGDNSEVW